MGANQVIDTERAILGAVLISPQALPSASLKASDFSARSHRVVWQSFRRLDETGRTIDTVSLKARRDRPNDRHGFVERRPGKARGA